MEDAPPHQQQSTEGHVVPQIDVPPTSPPRSTEGPEGPRIEEQLSSALESTEGHVRNSSNDPIIEDISISQFLTDTQQSFDRVDQPLLQLPTDEHKAASPQEAFPDVSSASNEQLQLLLQQALSETQNRWARSQNQLWDFETSTARAWKQCKEAAEPVFGAIPEAPDDSRVDEMASLCTRLASEAERWRMQYRDSAQEATVLLADSFEEFRTADDRLKEVEPAVAAQKAVLDNWALHCDQAYEQEQSARAHAHHLRVHLQQSTDSERPQVQTQLEQQQQQIAELSERATQWLTEGKKAQSEIQQLQAKVTTLHSTSQQIIEAVGPQLENAAAEPLPVKIQHFQAVAVTKVAISETLGEWQALQHRLRLTAPAILSTCTDHSADQLTQPGSSSPPAQ